MKIEDNVWSAGDDNWDVEVEGPMIIIRRAPRDAVLQLHVTPPRAISIDRINMELEGVVLIGVGQKLESYYSGDQLPLLNLQGCTIKGQMRLSSFLGEAG